MITLDYEIAHIMDNDIALFVNEMTKHFPRSFWYMPASSTGKYHPSTSLGAGGLVVHTKQVFWIAKAMLDTKMFNANHDIVLASCVLHDGWKYDGRTRHTNRYHARLACQKIRELYQSDKPWFEEILACILSHNGRFTNEFTGKMTIEQIIVHVADYIASRPSMEFNVDKLEKL
jgi:hypothetical protein